MISEGEEAPAFELPAIVDGERTTLDLADSTSNGRVVLILFYPFDFSPVCTTELCALRDAEWFEFTSNLDLWAISGDSTHAHRVFAEEYDLTFPLLSDFNANTAKKYDIRYESWENHSSVPQRAVFLVDPEQTVQYAWTTEDAYTQPDFVPVKAALDELSQIDSTVIADGVDLDIEYGSE